MRRLFIVSTLLWSLLLVHQAARADGVTHVALDETFNVNNGTGGRADGFSGTIASNSIQYNLEGWSNTGSVYGGYQCIRFGTGNANGSCTTPGIILIGTGKTATLTFNAAGWGSGSNTLTVTANAGVTLSGDTQVTLTNSTWTAYSVTVTLTTATSVQLTFSGKRGFLDDVKVTETVTAINAPTLTDECSFWPTTVETAANHITLVPQDSTTVYYTTDGSEPSPSNGHVATLTSNIAIAGTTTVKARAYYGTVASDVVSKTYTVGSTVDGIAAFKALADDTEARIYLADDADHETRVLYYDESRHQLFLRDKTGALCVDFGTTATFNPTPQYNQHVAGWIVGRKQTVDGLPKLVATGNTTTDFLAIANRVTESQTEPNSIGNDELDDHMADWVTISEQRVGTDLGVTDRFGTGAYDGALADLSGIVIANDATVQVAPIAQNDVPAVVYVIDENQEFVSPDADIAGATIRLKRTLTSGIWNTFAVPFDIASMAGSIREYDHADGNTMVFKNAAGIEAGKPYLVKPTADIENPVYENVTLSSTTARQVEAGDYSFVAVYQPTALATNKSELFLKQDGLLYYPGSTSSSLKGMRAFFRVPVGQAARVAFGGEETGILQVNGSGLTVSGNVYDLQGRRVKTPGRGLYIRNGKKIIIH